MIEDPELRALFQAENEERIANIKRGLIELQTKYSQEIIDSIFRDAHTIKGAARMLSIHEIERLAHSMEEIFDSIRKGNVLLNAEIVQDLFLKIQEIEKLVFEQVSPPKKQPKPVKEALPPPSPSPKESEILKEVEASETAEPVEEGPVVSFSEKKSHFSKNPLGGLQAATVRITKRQIFELTGEAGDLTVAKNRITTIVDEMEEILRYVEKVVQTVTIRETAEIVTSIQEIEETLREVEKRLSKLRDSSYEDVYKLNVITTRLVNKIRRLGLVPFTKLFELFPKMVEDLSDSLGKKIEFTMQGEDITVDKKIIEEMKDPIIHLLRNAIFHGIETPEEREAHSKSKIGHLRLQAQQISHTILIEVIDDGSGLNLARIKEKALEMKLVTEDVLNTLPIEDVYSMIFIPGFSTSDEVTSIGGRGYGMDVVKANVEALHGTIQVQSEAGHGCRFTIELPTTVLTTLVSLVQIYNNIYAIPVEAVESVCLVSMEDIFQINNQDMFLFNNQPITVALLANLLGVAPPSGDQSQNLSQLIGSKLPCLVFNVRGKKMAVLVDAILDEQQVVLVPFEALLTKIPNISGATTLKTGQVCVVIDPLQIIKKASTISAAGLVELKEKMVNIKKKKILLVDDSYAIRLYCKRILEEEGYDVIIAEDGMQALQKLEEESVDAVITDVQMPKMDGFTLVSTIRNVKKNYMLPIILITTLESESDRRKGLELGANAYIGKSAFSQKNLVNMLKNFIV